MFGYPPVRRVEAGNEEAEHEHDHDVIEEGPRDLEGFQLVVSPEQTSRATVW